MEDIHDLEQQPNKETSKPSTGHLCYSLDRACAFCTEGSSLYCRALGLRSLQDTYVIHSLFPLFPVRSNEGLKSQNPWAHELFLILLLSNSLFLLTGHAFVWYLATYAKCKFESSCSGSILVILYWNIKRCERSTSLCSTFIHKPLSWTIMLQVKQLLLLFPKRNQVCKQEERVRVSERERERDRGVESSLGHPQHCNFNR